MVEREDVRDEARGNRGFATIILGLVGVVGVVFVAFLIYYAFIAPERVAAPTDVFEAETPSEGVGVPDGGELTNQPTQAAPDSPSRTVVQTQEP